MKEYTRQAHAKINLSLDVRGKRADGYHEVSMVMHQISLADQVSLCMTSEEGIVLTTDSAQIPTDEHNIAYRAAQLMLSRFSIGGGVRIHIAKKIPVAGGLAGGSTDAAAVLRLMNDACSLGLDGAALRELGLQLGADVPYCLFEKPALSEGIGEKLTEICGLPPCVILIVNPGVEISTKEIYERVDDYCHEPVDNAQLIRCLRQGELCEAKQYMKNVMQPVSAVLCPRINEIIQEMNELGAIHAMMSGSGATCFGIFPKDWPFPDNLGALFPGCAAALAEPYHGRRK